jgi:hypothetical protein
VPVIVATVKITSVLKQATDATGFMILLETGISLENDQALHACSFLVVENG